MTEPEQMVLEAVRQVPALAIFAYLIGRLVAAVFDYLKFRDEVLARIMVKVKGGNGDDSATV